MVCSAESVIESNSFFSARLYQALDTTDQNVAYSPLSIHTLLSVLYQWSAGGTEDVLQTILNLPDKLSTAREYEYILPSIVDAPNITLKVASKFYISSGKRPENDKKYIPRGSLNTELEYMDFTNAKKAAKKINRWFKIRTQGRISDVVTPEDLNQRIHCLLLNAIYFKGDWLGRFNQKHTKPLPFNFLNSRPPITTYMMERLGHYYYGELHNDGSFVAQVLKLRFRDRRYNMFIILPTVWRTIEQIEQILEDIVPDQLNAMLKMQYVQVSLPRFKIQVKYDLGPPLEKVSISTVT